MPEDFSHGHVAFHTFLWLSLYDFCAWQGLLPSPVYDGYSSTGVCDAASFDRDDAGASDLDLRDQRRCDAWKGAFSASGNHYRLWFLRTAVDLDLDGLQTGA